MPKPSDVRPVAAELYLLPATLRVPLKFGLETTTQSDCARVSVVVEDAGGRRAVGWGETPLAVIWAWASGLSYAERRERMTALCRRLTRAWVEAPTPGHALEVGHDFISQRLPELLAEEARGQSEPIPLLAALVCASAFDIATHDAQGILLDKPTYSLYTREFLNRDLADYLEPAPGADVDFRGRYPGDFFVTAPPRRLVAWHLVGGLDPLEPPDLKGDEPQDGYPVTLVDWIARDGLDCLKIKLRGTDLAWDSDRLARVGRIALERGVRYLTADFNCTVTDPAYVHAALDRLEAEHPEVWRRMLYVEQPFPYDLDAWPIDVHTISCRKPLFLDESAHDWRHVRHGRELGWNGVALKTCKTQTGALLSLCWAKAHGMALMVQDLTNPRLAQIPHVLLAAHAGTIMGVETNGMQFYPEVSRPEAVIHPGLYRRRDGHVDFSTVGGAGFGYRVREIPRELPPALCRAGR